MEVMDRGQKNEAETGASGRDLRLDLLRGIAVLLMTEQHLGIWLVDFKSYRSSLGPLIYLNMLGGMAAPLFVLIAGVGAALALEKGTAQESMARGVRLLAVGFVLNGLTPGWFGWASFYVLHLLGVWLMVAPALRKLPRWGVLTLGFAALAAGALGQIALRTPPALTNLRMSGRLGTEPWRLALFEGHFPLFPWLFVALVGFSVSTPYRQGRARWLAGLSAACAALALIAHSPAFILGRGALLLPWRAISGLEFYPATPALLLGLTAVGLALLALLTQYKGKLHELHPLVLFGRTSLTLLVVHVVLFREVFGRIGLGNRFSPPVTLLIIVATWIGWWLFARAWAKSGFRYGCEWFLRARSSRP